MNVRRGLFRAWLLGTAIWFAALLGFTESGYRATYTYLYYFQHDQLEQEASTTYQREVAEWQNNPLTRTMLQPERPKLHGVPEPDLEWLALLLLPPTLGVALLYLAVIVLRKVLRWLVDGFRG